MFYVFILSISKFRLSARDAHVFSRYLLVALLVCVAASLADCSGNRNALTPPSATITPEGATSMVFGSVQVFLDGAPQNTSFIASPSTIVSIDVYTGTPLSNHESPRPKYSFETFAKEDGFFQIALPPGKYYVRNFYYWDADISVYGLRYSSYESTLKATVYSPKVITFDVLPGRATYIGNLQQRMDRTEDRQHFSLSETVADNFPAAKAHFLDIHPSWSNAVGERLMLIDPVSFDK
jgi:hypothetical protein